MKKEHRTQLIFTRENKGKIQAKIQSIKMNLCSIKNIVNINKLKIFIIKLIISIVIDIK